MLESRFYDLGGGRVVIATRNSRNPRPGRLLIPGSYAFEECEWIASSGTFQETMDRDLLLKNYGSTVEVSGDVPRVSYDYAGPELKTLDENELLDFVNELRS